MNYNYHTHTYMCGHASGTLVEYVEKAIEGGIEYMGFSDHIPHIGKNGKESSFRVPYDKTNEYISNISALREVYKEKIEISIGFESEYYPDVFTDMVHYAMNAGCEYLILGPHFIQEEQTDKEHTINPTDSVEFLQQYVSNVISAIESGVFTYVAHPDILRFTGDDSVYREQMRKLCKASYKNNIPLEINFLGIRGNRCYPNELFWQLAGEEKSPVTFGFDAHTIDSACDKKSQIKAQEIVNKNNLNYIGKPEIIRLKNK